MATVSSDELYRMWRVTLPFFHKCVKVPVGYRPAGEKEEAMVAYMPYEYVPNGKGSEWTYENYDLKAIVDPMTLEEFRDWGTRLFGWEVTDGDS